MEDLLKKSAVSLLSLISLALSFFVFTPIVKAKSPPPAVSYAPSLWFDADEQYYPTNPLNFYFENDKEISGKTAVKRYNQLSLQEKLSNLTTLYHIQDHDDQWVYQYWLFYVFNDFKKLTKNKHYGDWESVFVFVDKESKQIVKAIGTAHQRRVFDTEIYEPQNNHIWTYVSNGSHANCIDEKSDGYCDFYMWSKMEQWDKNGKKISYDNYNLKEITPKFINNFKGATTLEKSSELGINLLDFLKVKEKKLYIPLGGRPPTHAWAQSNYHNPEEIRPYSLKSTLEKIKQTKDKIAKSFNDLKDRISVFLKGEKDDQQAGTGGVTKEGEQNGEIKGKLSSIDLTKSVENTSSGQEIELEAPETPESSEDKAEPEPVTEEPTTQEREEPNPPSETSAPVDEPEPTKPVDKSKPEPTKPKEEEKAQENQPVTQSESPTKPSPFIMGVGGAPPQEENSNKNNSQKPKESNLKKNKDTTPPILPSVNSPKKGAILNSILVNFFGDGEASSTIFFSKRNAPFASTTVNTEGKWQREISLNEGTTTIRIFAEDNATNQSAATTTQIFIDQTAPNITLNSQTCRDKSLSQATTTCFIKSNKDASTTISFSWQSDANDLTYFNISKKGVFSTTTSTSTQIEYSPVNESDFSISARDKNGNTSATTTKTIKTSPQPIVINEIAWMGNTSNSKDEWIELYNNSNKEIDLSNWVLRAEDGAPYLKLKESVEAGKYYLIERTDDKTVSGILADLVTPFSGQGSGRGLGNGGENLLLQKITQNATTTIDEVPYDNNWFAGSDHSYLSMERYSPDLPSNDRNNWGNNDGRYIIAGKNIDGYKISGTPKQKNSVSYEISKGAPTLKEYKTLREEDSPYFVDDEGFTIREGTTLTIEPGVVIKVAYDGYLKIKGKIEVNGTEEKPVIFTSIHDDSYGGDTNNNSTSTKPSAGNWKGLVFRKESANATSTISHAKVLYAGEIDHNSAIEVKNSGHIFNNLTIEKTSNNGIYLEDSYSKIEESTFKDANSGIRIGYLAGIYISRGAPSIKNSTFENNDCGMRLSHANGALVENNTFKGNREAIHNSGLDVSFKGNTGSGNEKNAILIHGNTPQNATTTLFKNKLPYLLGEAINLEVISSSTLLFEDGVVIKGETGGGNSIRVEDGGKLYHHSTSADSLIFTSERDNTTMGKAVSKTNVASPPTSSAGDWVGIRVEEGGQIDLSGFTLRFAGEEQWKNENGGIEIAGAIATSSISNAIIENNYHYGIKLTNSAKLSISNSEILGHGHTEKGTGRATGLYLKDNSSAYLEDVNFSGNEYDVRVKDENKITCSTTSPPDLDLCD